VRAAGDEPLPREVDLAVPFDVAFAIEFVFRAGEVRVAILATLPTNWRKLRDFPAMGACVEKNRAAG
jgi:SH3-like domain-containing protein